MARYDSQALIPLKLCFRANVVNRLYDYFDESFITPGGDGSFILEVALPSGNGFAQRMKEALKFYGS